MCGFFRIIANFPDGFKTVLIFPDDCQFSGRFQKCPDFSGSFPIFRTVSKMSLFADVGEIRSSISRLIDQLPGFLPPGLGLAEVTSASCYSATQPPASTPPILFVSFLDRPLQLLVYEFCKIQSSQWQSVHINVRIGSQYYNLTEIFTTTTQRSTCTIIMTMVFTG